MARDGFSQAGDFFARAMQMQNAAAEMQSQAQAPAFSNSVITQENTPGSALFRPPSINTLPVLEEAAMRSPAAQPSPIVSELLSKAKQRRIASMAESETMEPTMSQTSSEAASSFPQVPRLATGGIPVESEFRPQIGRRPQTSVRAGQFSA